MLPYDGYRVWCSMVPIRRPSDATPIARGNAPPGDYSDTNYNYFSGVAMLKLQACAKLCTLCLYNFGVSYNSEITQTLFLERSAIMPF